MHLLRLITDGSSLFVADSNSVRRMDIASSTVVTVAGTNASGATDGLGPAARFNAISGLSRDAAGNLYVADAGNATLRKLTPLP